MHGTVKNEVVVISLHQNRKATFLHSWKSFVMKIELDEKEKEALRDLLDCYENEGGFDCEQDPKIIQAMQGFIKASEWLVEPSN